ncbi:MAG: ABC transporter substrate-binding protein [Pikeienuella sp.]
MADPICGMNTGEAATGEPVIVGGIHGNGAPGDFSASTDAAKAYFDCVNANGGINGRPIDYRVENDQWNPELAAQAAAKLVGDAGAVALVGNSSFIEMAVNAQTYVDNGIMVMASACAISECFETPLMSVYMFPGTIRLPRCRRMVKVCSPVQALETTDRTDGYHALIRGLVTA